MQATAERVRRIGEAAGVIRHRSPNPLSDHRPRCDDGGTGCDYRDDHAGDCPSESFCFTLSCFSFLLLTFCVLLSDPFSRFGLRSSINGNVVVVTDGDL
jgi:hypothetical protein